MSMAKLKKDEEQEQEPEQQVVEQQVADSIKGKSKGKGTEYFELSFGSSDEDDFSLEELLKMEDAINFAVSLSGNHKLSASCIAASSQRSSSRWRIYSTRSRRRHNKQNKPKQNKSLNQSIKQSGPVLLRDS
jgi:hypothetical protein